MTYRLLLLLGAAALLAPAQATFEGQPAVTLSNDKLTLTILGQGTAFAELLLKDDPSLPSPLWNPARMSRELGRNTTFNPGTGHFLCVDGFGPVSPEERAAGLPGHGEAHLQLFDAHSLRQGKTSEVTLTAKLPIVQESVSRRVRMIDGENVVYVDTTLENLLGFDRPVNWAEHATVGSPFLESGVTVFDLSGSRSQTRPYADANPNSANQNQSQRRLPKGQDFTWPMAPGIDGQVVDMRQTPNNAHYLDHTTTLLDPSRQLEWVTALNPKSHLILGYVFRRDEYPWLQTWGNYPASGKFSRGMEFGTQPYDVSRREAVGMGTMFGAPTYRWLPAKGKIESHFLFFYAHVPEGFTKIDDVRVESGQIVIESAGKRVTLPASLAMAGR
ncbi:MAG: hypothetical protein ABUS49_13020 [Acidobacteriota bacterium]